MPSYKKFFDVKVEEKKIDKKVEINYKIQERKSTDE
jgi:hypothetical protein